MAKAKADAAASQRAHLYAGKLNMIVSDGGDAERVWSRLARMLPKAEAVGAVVPEHVTRWMDANPGEPVEMPVEPAPVEPAPVDPEPADPEA